MAIRSAAKAVIIRDGKVLLNLCRHEDGREYYDLPGGGQNLYESLEDAVCREVLEETGYTVAKMRFAALSEEIHTDERLRREYPDYSHRMLHIFAVDISNAPQAQPAEVDRGMEKSVWVDIGEVEKLTETYPGRLSELVENIAGNGPVMWLGTEYR